jgi:hypothetical protein
MARKHNPEEIIGKLREAEIVLAQGGTVADACRRIGVTEQSYYLSVVRTVRRQDIWLRSRRRLAEDRPRLGVDVRRLACGVASADVR